MNEQAPNPNEQANSQAGLAATAEVKRQQEMEGIMKVAAHAATSASTSVESVPSMPQSEPHPDIITEVPGAKPNLAVAEETQEVITADQVPKA